MSELGFFGAGVVFFATLANAAAPPAATISAIAVEPRFFNPALGQVATIRFTLGARARVAVSILDRDRFVVRRLPPRDQDPGRPAFTWDGKDDAGATVPDEAYSLLIEAATGGRSELYDPSAGFTPQIEGAEIRSYSRSAGVLSYTLSRPSRVHIQAGQATADSKSGQMQGPILKTLVDREPRVAGAVVETWNGMDEGGTVYVPGLPHFAMAVLATSLPDHSLIVSGVRGGSFLDYARAHRPGAAAAARSAAAQPAAGSGLAAGPHHRGLDAFQDHSPPLLLRTGGRWDAARQSWSAGPSLVVEVTIPEERAAPFLGQPNELTLYVDETPVARVQSPKNPWRMSLDRQLDPGEHRLVVNWSSDFGPVAVAVTRVFVVPGAGAASPSGGKR